MSELSRRERYHLLVGLIADAVNALQDGRYSKDPRAKVIEARDKLNRVLELTEPTKPVE